MLDDFRILKFNLSSLSLSDKIASIQLVLKQSSSIPSSYVSQLYEIIGNSTKQIMLDSGEYPGQWHTLQVQNIEDFINADSLRRNYHLAQEKNEDEISIVGEGSWKTKKEKRRNTDRSHQTVAPHNLECMRNLSCRKQSTSSLDVMLSDVYRVTVPTQLNFSFCYGTYTSPLQVGQMHLYRNHAKLIALIAPNQARTRISPCCVPHEMTTIPMIHQSTISQIFYMISFPVVVSCRCM